MSLLRINACLAGWILVLNGLEVIQDTRWHAGVYVGAAIVVAASWVRP